ncbi:MAG: NADH-quinone oxidoreductase subunit N [Planctomycetes bacterium]|nr:NADH-quinone oxidoreductase subunit N [Planctomycetota bacterium]
MSAAHQLAPEAIASQFRTLFDASAWSAVAPLAALSAGVVLCLITDLSRALAALRGPLVFAALAACAWFQVQLLLHPVGVVLRDSLHGDATSAAFGLLFVAGGLLAWLASHGYYKRDGQAPLAEHDALLLSAVAGMTLMSAANDLLVFFIGLELLSLPLYALSALRRSRAASVEAGLKYFLLGAFTSALFLFGCALIYCATGSIGLDTLRVLAAPGSLPMGELALLGSALIAASLLFKLNVFPFHVWVPDVYQGSPTPVTALMATGTKAAAFAFLLRASFLLPASASTTLALLALITLAIGNLGALVQEDFKRMLAYSGIAHAGTLLLAVAGALGGDPVANGATRAIVFYLAAYVFSAGGAFAVLAALEAGGERFTKLENLRGLWQRKPIAALALALFMLSLGGIPGAGGFWGKWFVFEVLVRADMTGWAIAGVLMSVLALAYYLRVIIALFMQPTPAGIVAPRFERPASLGASLVLCVGAVLLTGLLPGMLLGLLG